MCGRYVRKRGKSHFPFVLFRLSIERMRTLRALYQKYIFVSRFHIRRIWFKRAPVQHLMHTLSAIYVLILIISGTQSYHRPRFEVFLERACNFPSNDEYLLQVSCLSVSVCLFVCSLHTQYRYEAKSILGKHFHTPTAFTAVCYLRMDLPFEHFLTASFSHFSERFCYSKIF